MAQGRSSTGGGPKPLRANGEASQAGQATVQGWPLLPTVQGAVQDTWPEGPVWDRAKEEKNWLVRDAKKVPLDAKTGWEAPYQKAATLTFDEAQEAAKRLGAAGVGYLPREGSAMVGIDIDKCVGEDGQIEPWTEDLIKNAGSYIELSPSGRGLRVLIARDDAKETVGHAEKNGVGIIEDGKKYFTVTGRHLGGDRAIVEADDLRRRVLARRGEEKASQSATQSRTAGSEADEGRWGGIAPERRVEALRDALKHVPCEPDDRDTWLKHSAAVKNAMAGAGGIPEDELREIWDEWCDGVGGNIDKNDEAWASLDPKKRGGRTVASIFAEARSNGWDAGAWGYHPGGSARGSFAPLEGSGTTRGASKLTLSAAPIGSGSLTRTHYDPPKVLVEGLIPCAPFTIVGAGGIGKSTFTLALLVHVILGRKLWGLEVNFPGPVVLVTAEDKFDHVMWRLREICRAMGLSRKEMAKVENNHVLMDMTEQGIGVRLAELDRAGNMKEGELAEALIEALGRAKVEPVLVLFDPLSYFGPGENHMNDGAAAVMRVLWKVSNALGEAAVGVIHHTGQEAARSGIDDQYAGRGGSALADNARAVIVLTAGKNRPDDLPSSVTDDQVEAGRVVSVNLAKNSYGPLLGRKLFFVRGQTEPWDFDFMEGLTKAAARRSALGRQEQAILDWIEDENAVGRIVTRTRIRENSQDIAGIGKDAARDRAEQLISDGRIEERELPLGHSERKRNRKHQLVTVDRADSASESATTDASDSSPTVGQPSDAPKRGAPKSTPDEVA